jgi:hypothetical protein
MQLYSRLPDCLQGCVNEYLTDVFAMVQQIVNDEYFREYVALNTERIKRMMENWSKRDLGFVLNAILTTNTTHQRCFKLVCYLQDVDTWVYESAKLPQMRDDVITYIGHRAELPDCPKILALTGSRRYNGHFYNYLNFHDVVIKDEHRSPIRVYGAYQALEAFDAKLQERVTQMCIRRGLISKPKTKSNKNKNRVENC